MSQPEERFNAERAAAYDRRMEQIVPGYSVLHRIVDVILSHELGDEANVLVVGAGTGYELLVLAKSHPGWRFTAVDPSPAMIAIGRQKLKDAGFGDRVTWMEGTTDDLEEETTFDAATLMLVLHFIEKHEQLSMLNGIASRLNPGAPLLLAGIFGDRETTRYKRLEALTKTWAETSGLDAQGIEDVFNPNRKDLHPFTEESLKAMLREAGLIDVQRIYQALRVGAWMARTNR